MRLVLRLKSNGIQKLFLRLRSRFQECSDTCKLFDDGYTFNKDECTQCHCEDGAETCVDICSETFSEWSDWSQCPICGQNATQQSYRSCSGLQCKQKTEILNRNCDIPDCHDALGCRVSAQLRNFTRSGCSAMGYIINYFIKYSH